MKIWVILASFVTIVSCSSLMVVIGLGVWAFRAYAWAVRMDGKKRRTGIATISSWMGRSVRWLFCFLMRIDCRFVLPKGWKELRRPCVVIMNHQHTLDIVFKLGYCGKVNLPYLVWVMKRELKYAPVIGSIARDIRSAFVVRNKKTGVIDTDEIQRCAEFAFADGASVEIFPDGTRITRERVKPGFERVLPPKLAGFQTLLKHLPGYPVMSLTIRWEHFFIHPSKTMFGIEHLYGQRVDVVGRLAPRTEVDCDPEWLTHEWQRKNQELMSPLT